ncbi:ComEC/Rec2 family competence protein [Segatella copri]|jgi:ComEC/Rec2-related protein|uniref:ComEC/Rec2 family competence protein n=1 Tax=Segatella copri TaxID=165179 RepID=UPI001C46D7CD|nr:ComEC/Rec2 family competence protein [Segatella copri]WOZ86203.1 ComEC/Rec2 family competence protein [Segatella copri]
MDRIKKQHFTPLMSFSLVLTAGIITAKYSYDYLSMRHWLAISILPWSIAACCYMMTQLIRRHNPSSRIIDKLIHYQCLNLYLCIFCLGSCITTHHIDHLNAPVQIKAYQSLSSFERTILKAQDFRQQAEQQLHTLHIGEQDFAVIAAMAMGDKSALNQETKEAYSISGTSHILAVSGLHIGIIFQLIILLLGGKRRSKLTIILSTTIVWAYVIFIGFPASAVRAATMLSIYSMVLLSLRPDPTLNTLALAYIIMVLVNPFNIFDIGFQMSFLAVGSILLFYPLFFCLLSSHSNIIRAIWGLFCVSLAAQIGTLPLIVFYFGRISCYSLITSFIAIPAATLILYLCVLLFILSPLTYISFLASSIEGLMQLVMNVLTSITQFINTAFRLTSMLPGASIEHVHLSLLQLAILYVAILAGYFAFVKWYRLKEKMV